MSGIGKLALGTLLSLLVAACAAPAAPTAALSGPALSLIHILTLPTT
jgi:hypothetical protein